GDGPRRALWFIDREGRGTLAFRALRLSRFVPLVSRPWLVPVWLTLALSASAQEPAPPGEGRTRSTAADGRKYKPRLYLTQRLAGEPPTIDGRLDDAAWQQGEWAG
ncbi:MAG TPA: hypothetical protein VLV54_14400, partial [Thermoanaerobaculia bacterium]|nr:hypothetical protein [Thermoanaerobaculia bacterium]